MGNHSSSAPENETNLDHLTSNPNYQSTLRSIYSNNVNIPAFPGASLNYQGIPTHRDMPITMKKATPLRNEFLFDKSSVSLIPTIDITVYFLTFKFSSETEVQITVYFQSKETTETNENDENVTKIETDTSKYPMPQTFVFGAGKNQKFNANSLTLDTKLYTKEQLTSVVDECYPLIIKIVMMKNFLFGTHRKIKENITGDHNDVEKKALYTYYKFKWDDKIEAKVIKQKLEYKDKVYVLDDIYGTANNDRLDDDSNQDGKDCAICLSNKMNTVVLPCKHICLCVDCAKNLRDKNNQKCPMCRKYVETFLVLKRNKKDKRGQN